MATRTLEDRVLNSQRQLANVKYKDLYSVLESEISEDIGKNNGATISEIKDSVGRYSRLFTSVMRSISDVFANDEIANEISDKDNFVRFYGSYVAAKTVLSDLNRDQSSKVQEHMEFVDNKFQNRELISLNQTEYSTVRVALENMVESINRGKSSAKVAMVDYFTTYANQVLYKINNLVSEEFMKKISEINWKIGPYTIKGVDPVVVESTSPHSATNLLKKDSNIFSTPLRYLHIPKEKVLKRDEIIGDKSIITNLEREVKALFLYDSEKRRNPLKEKGLFHNKILLQGTPGTGKGAVSFYLIDFAERMNESLGRDLMVTNFGINSHWRDGSIQKLKSQLDEITNSNKIFFIYEDEIDGLLMDENSMRQDKQDNTLIQEFNKFMDGQYADNGNYILLGNINDVSRLRASNRRRFVEYNWRGADSALDKSRLIKAKLNSGIKAGYVVVSDKDIRSLGELAQEYELSGADLTSVCELACSESFLWDRLEEVYRLKGDYNAQIGLIDNLHSELNYGVLRDRLIDFKTNIENSNRDSVKSYSA